MGITPAPPLQSTLCTCLYLQELEGCLCVIPVQSSTLRSFPPMSSCSGLRGRMVKSLQTAQSGLNREQKVQNSKFNIKKMLNCLKVLKNPVKSMKIHENPKRSLLVYIFHFHVLDFLTVIQPTVDWFSLCLNLSSLDTDSIRFRILALKNDLANSMMAHSGNGKCTINIFLQHFTVVSWLSKNTISSMGKSEKSRERVQPLRMQLC
jgi:hypothetical protein